MINKCCKKEKKKEGGFWNGLIYGLIPHIGCIAFVVFSILGVTTATALFRPFLLNRYFFYILIALSLFFATISAFFYLKKQGFIFFNKNKEEWEFNFQPSGIKKKWKYLLTLYGTTMAINLILFMVIFPVLATLDAEQGLSLASITNVFESIENKTENPFSPSIVLEVDIPCPGHAPLITGELRTILGVEGVRYRFPNRFIVNYNPEKTSQQQILALDVFNTYKAIIIN